MRLRLAARLTLAVASTMLAACGGDRGGQLPVPTTPNSPAVTGEFVADLPVPGKLPNPQRKLSIAGPGFFNVPLEEMVARNGTSFGPGTLTLDGGASTGYVIYGVFGFDGDNGPTSARITTSAVSNEYFVCFSDYISGQWQMAGPFTDSAEVEIPNTDEYTSPTAYTSPAGTCYFGVICSPGDSLTLTAVELGVQGGVMGPEPPFTFDGGTGDAPNFFLQWSNSSSYKDPDFAGYILQRAPLLEGSYADLYSDPLEETFFNDSTAESDVNYRYRLCSEDASGNRSIWRTVIDGPVSGQKSSPILRLDIPLGPLHGPIDVHFDLSGSFDPEGEGITAYAIAFPSGLAPLTGPGPTYTATLQPGCYVVVAYIECAGPPLRSATNRFNLVVYPRWQDTPAVVREPYAPTTFDTRRLLRSSGTFNSTADRVTFCGVDVSSIGFNIYSAPASDPAALSVTRLPAYFFPLAACDAFDVSNTTYYAYLTAKGAFLVSFDGATALQQVISITPDSPHLSAAVDGTQVWLFFDYFDGINTNLLCLPTSFGAGFTVVPATGTLTAIDALYNPATDTIDVVYGGSAGGTTEWVRVDTASAAVVDSANIDPAVAADDIDLELDPVTGRPLVLYTHTAIHRFRELDELNVWTPEVQVDNSIMNYTPLDLIVDDGIRYAYFRTGPAGQAVLYRDDGGAWSAVNTVGFSADSGLEVALIPQPGSSDRALVLDMDSPRDYHLARLHDDGTDTVIWQLPHSDGQGFELQAAAATDGLHAVWRSLGTSLTRHGWSADGETWSDPGDIGLFYQNCGLASDADGDFYFSCTHFGNSELYWWNGAAFNFKDTHPGGTAYRPFFATTPQTNIAWCAYDNAATTMHYVDVNEPAYVDNPVLMASTPIWDGVANVAGLSDKYAYTLVGGSSPEDGSVCWSLLGAFTADQIYQPSILGALEIFTSPITTGRVFASTSYIGSIQVFPEQAMFCTRGGVLNPNRFTVPLIGEPSLDDIVVGKDYSIFSAEDLLVEDIRNTASCAQAYSLTGLVLISSGDGARSYFAWSRYGDWEELPLPDGIEYLSMPQIVVGLDGRWHIIYKNWATDQMMCINTET